MYFASAVFSFTALTLIVSHRESCAAGIKYLVPLSPEVLDWECVLTRQNMYIKQKPRIAVMLSVDFVAMFNEISVLCRDVTVCRELPAGLCAETTSSSLLPAAELGEPELQYSLAAHMPYFLTSPKNEIYDIRM